MKRSLDIPVGETIEGSALSLREGRISCVGLVERCQRAFETWETEVAAWVIFDPTAALEQARELDIELQEGRPRGPLHGIPIGVKDIIDVQGMPTVAGSLRWSNGPAPRDAPLITLLRSRGAIVLGKTVTTPYAFTDPPPTRNPWDRSRTPGGSSSGSAAAVATGMCLAAIGTQTAGSVTRPASYCGVASVKYGSWRFASDGPGMEGILPLAPSLDAVGVFARTVRDLEFLGDNGIGAASEGTRSRGRTSPPRLGRLRGFFEERGEPATRTAFDRAIKLFEGAGAEVVEIPCPPEFDRTPEAVRTIMAAECAAFHRSRFGADPDDYPPRIAELIREGMKTPAADYLDALRLRRTLKASLREAIGSSRIEALVTPATTGPAPGPETTGSPAFNGPWNFLDAETMSFPIGLCPDGLPLSIQFASTPSEGRLPTLAVVWCEDLVRASFSNPERG